MTFPLNSLTRRVLSTLFCTTALAACGGGGGGSSSDASSVTAGVVVAKGGSTATGPLTAATPVATPTTPSTPTVPVTPEAPSTPVATPTAGLTAVTDIRLQNTGTAAQTSVPVTFGQVFAVGDVKPTDIMAGRLEDNSMVALQMDVKARHADGSVRHAVFSTIVPTIAANATRTMSIMKNAAVSTAAVPTPAELLAAGFTASASATVAGVKYSASADQLIKAGVKATWLAGSIANEWQVSAPLTTAAGVAHPHLTARFAVRYYSAVKKARVDVTIENNWAYEAAPQNFKYNAEVVVGGKSVYAKSDLTHLVHARWRKLFWWGGEAPAVNPMLNTKYLIASRAVPNYDQTVTIAPNVLANLDSSMKGANIEPMGLGVATSYMPMTGAHDDIGILPNWATTYVLTMDQRARTATLGTGDGAGSFSMHYRDKVTDRPISLTNYPYMTQYGNYGDTWNPTTNRMEAFPACGGTCDSPYTHDISHQPSLAYLPYLVTGDYYYLEEMQFWAMFDVFASNPNYRGNALGLVHSEQLRGQAWALRTLAEAAYITPDADVLKKDLVGFMNNNLDWYNTTYTNNASANKIGVLINGASVAYADGTQTAPWMDDFFTSAIGHAAELGFDKAKSLLAWKAKFTVGRMTAPGMCWTMGAAYAMTIRNTSDSPVYATLLESFTHDNPPALTNLACNSPAMAAYLNRPVGDMGQISDGYMGYPSNMQPALAYSVDSGIATSATAWSLFMGRTVKPNYGLGAQFAIVPR